MYLVESEWLTWDLALDLVLYRYGVLILAILCTVFQNIVLTIIFHFVTVLAKLTVLVA